MPSGYTDGVATGDVSSFVLFASQCARAFGALASRRDEPLDFMLPEPSEADTSYRDEQIAEAKRRLADLDVMGDEEYADEVADSHQEDLRRHEERVAEQRQARARYEAMIVKVLAWVPPTPEHTALKAFMLEQLNTSIGWDCRETAGPLPPDPVTERARERASCERDIRYHEEAREKEIERHTEAQAWIEALKRSLADYQE